MDALELLDYIEELQAENFALKGIVNTFTDLSGQPLDWRFLLKHALADPQTLGSVRERHALLRRSLTLATDGIQAAQVLVRDFHP